MWSAHTRKESLTVATTWKTFEDVMLSDETRPKKTSITEVHFHSNSQRGSRMAVARGWGGRWRR